MVARATDVKNSTRQIGAGRPATESGSSARQRSRARNRVGRQASGLGHARTSTRPRLSSGSWVTVSPGVTMDRDNLNVYRSAFANSDGLAACATAIPPARNWRSASIPATCPAETNSAARSAWSFRRGARSHSQPENSKRAARGWRARWAKARQVAAVRRSAKGGGRPGPRILRGAGAAADSRHEPAGEAAITARDGAGRAGHFGIVRPPVDRRASRAPVGRALVGLGIMVMAMTRIDEFADCSDVGQARKSGGASNSARANKT